MSSGRRCARAAMTTPPTSRSWKRGRGILIKEGRDIGGWAQRFCEAKCRARSVYGQLELVALLLLLIEVGSGASKPPAARPCAGGCAQAHRQAHRRRAGWGGARIVLRCWGLGPWWAVIEAT